MPYPARRSDHAVLTAHRANGVRPIWRSPRVRVPPRRSFVHSPQAAVPPVPPRRRLPPLPQRSGSRPPPRPATVDPRLAEGRWAAGWPADPAAVNHSSSFAAATAAVDPGAGVAPPEVVLAPELARHPAAEVVPAADLDSGHRLCRRLDLGHYPDPGRCPDLGPHRHPRRRRPDSVAAGARRSCAGRGRGCICYRRHWRAVAAPYRMP
jgi:hypothetical protein